MHFVFVAGSRTLSRLNDEIRPRLDNIIAKNLTVLIGDANGADKAVQRYLAEQKYANVFVYCMEVCRNNVGDWPVRVHMAKSGTRRDRFYYGIKDAAMARDANWGLMLWDGHSKGTLTNTLNLLNADKKVLLYLGPNKQFSTLNTFENLREILNKYGTQDLANFVSSHALGGPERAQLPFSYRDRYGI